MSGHYPPLTCSDVKRILAKLGFSARTGRGGSHEQWVKDTPDGHRLKVTVDCPKSPFSQTLISSMARQAGLSKKAFYAVLDRS